MPQAAEPVTPSAGRGWLLAGLALAVTLAHLWLVEHALPQHLGEGAGASRIARMDVAFVRELAPTAPPAAPPPAPPRTAPRLQAPRPAAAASQPEAATRPEPAPPVAPAEPSAQAQAGADAAAQAQAAASAADATAALQPEPASPAAPAAQGPAVAFDWPPSTRLSYRLSGNFRGPVEGRAHVEWLRQGTRYQVHMDLAVGPAVAPLVSRRVSSEGEITPAGLYPLRYDEETRALFATPRRVQVLLAADTVRLGNGSELPRPPGVQDSASQFVHLTWLFTTQPERLRAGQTIELPLALPRRLEVWVYDVLGEEALDTPFGTIATLHVKPRRTARPGSDLVAELWFAPSLQYLPVRLLIRQDEQTFVDLMIERLPQQSEPAAAGGNGSGRLPATTGR